MNKNSKCYHIRNFGNVIVQISMKSIVFIKKNIFYVILVERNEFKNL